MNKTVMKVFLVIALLVLIFVGWSAFFGDSGILVTGYAAVADAVNGAWATVAGEGAELLPPEWGDTGGENNGNLAGVQDVVE